MIPDIKNFALLPAYFDYGATFLWAISGSLLGARKGYSPIGILTIAIVSSTGGGLLRDGFFIQDGPPMLLRSSSYLTIIAVAFLLVVLIGQHIQRLKYFQYTVSLVDAVGLGAYAVVGMNRAFAAGVSVPGVIVIGMVNAVGGSILRDVMIRSELSILQPGTLEESLALVGCILFVVLSRFLSYEQNLAAWITIAVVFTIRMIAIRYQIRSRPLRGFESYWGQPK